MQPYLFLCRPGFEGDLAAELSATLTGYGKAGEGQGRVLWYSQAPLQVMPVFARTGWAVCAEFGPLAPEDRVSALLPLLPPGRFGRLFLEHPDTNDGRALQRFLRGFRAPMEKALKKAGRLDPARPEVLHLYFEDSARGFIGSSHHAVWENGVPRLRLHREAPSRSALKLEEAWWRLLDETEQAHWLRPGMTAADLGAAPGGWSWQLARRGVRVQAVDHGRLRPGLEDEYPVTHLACDAFTWEPARTLDWVVCDIVDKPARTLALMIRWLSSGWARAALFNLKLPMKQRYRESAHLLERLHRALPEARIRASQLYHDREEITVLVLPGDGA